MGVCRGLVLSAVGIVKRTRTLVPSLCLNFVCFRLHIIIAALGRVLTCATVSTFSKARKCPKRTTWLRDPSGWPYLNSPLVLARGPKMATAAGRRANAYRPVRTILVAHKSFRQWSTRPAPCYMCYGWNTANGLRSGARATAGGGRSGERVVAAARLRMRARVLLEEADALIDVLRVP